jgi:hypothetical protein
LGLIGPGILAAQTASGPPPPEGTSTDGFVTIVVKGVALRLPSFEPDARNIIFYPSDTLRPKMSVHDVIADPQRARQLFDTSKTILVDIPNSAARRDLFLGRFERGSMPDLFSAAIGEGIEGICSNRDANWDRFRARVRDGHEIATDGWAEFHNPGSPPTWYYVKPAQAAGMPKDFDSLTCNSFDQCSAGACIRSVRFGYAFSRRDLPRAEWDKVVEGAREVWRTILGDGFWNQGASR